MALVSGNPGKSPSGSKKDQRSHPRKCLFFSKMKVLHLCVTFLGLKRGEDSHFDFGHTVDGEGKSHSQPPLGCIKPCKSWEIYHIKLVS